MIVHRFWEGPVSRITVENRRAVATFAAHTQWVWTYFCSRAMGVIDGVRIVYKDSAELLPVDKFRAFQRAGVWIQVIKDLLSIRAVINHGGWYSDLDIALLPRGLPSGSCFFLQPSQFAANCCVMLSKIAILIIRIIAVAF